MTAQNNLEFDIESLENRQMMAGDVSAALVNGDLVINGDNDGNAMHIYGNGDGFFAVYGSEGTTINGLNYFSTTGVSDDLRINLRNGDNRLSMVGLKPSDDISVRTGRGDDVVILQGGKLTSDINIRTGGGNDAVAVVESSIIGRMNVRTGGGNDDLLLVETKMDTGNINLGGGNDEAHIVRTESQGRTIHNMGGGNDLLRFLTIEGEFEFVGGGGTDYVSSHSANSGEPRSFEGDGVRVGATVLEYELFAGPIDASIDLYV